MAIMKTTATAIAILALGAICFVTGNAARPAASFRETATESR